MFFTIKLYLHLNCLIILNWIVWNRTIFIKMDLALNNLQRLICHKTQTTNQQIYFYIKYTVVLHNRQAINLSPSTYDPRELKQNVAVIGSDLILYPCSSHRSISFRESMPSPSDSVITDQSPSRAHWFLLPL